MKDCIFCKIINKEKGIMPFSLLTKDNKQKG